MSLCRCFDWALFDFLSQKNVQLMESSRMSGITDKSAFLNELQRSFSTFSWHQVTFWAEKDLLNSKGRFQHQKTFWPSRDLFLASWNVLSFKVRLGLQNWPNSHEWCLFWLISHKKRQTSFKNRLHSYTIRSLSFKMEFLYTPHYGNYKYNFAFCFLLQLEFDSNTIQYRGYVFSCYIMSR